MITPGHQFGTVVSHSLKHASDYIRLAHRHYSDHEKSYYLQKAVKELEKADYAVPGDDPRVLCALRTVYQKLYCLVSRNNEKRVLSKLTELEKRIHLAQPRTKQKSKKLNLGACTA